MKKLITFVSVVFVWLSSAAQPEKVFTEANQLYQQNEFAQATEMYEALVAQGYTNAALHYNLGNAFYRQNDIGKSILHYEKALKIDPTHADATHNLALANKRIIDKFNAVPTPPLQQIFMDASNWLSTDVWAIVGVVLAVLAAVCFGLFLFVWRSAFFSTGTVVFVILSFLFQAVAFGKNQLNSRVSAILTVQNAYVKSAPADSAQDLYIIHEGTKLVIQETFSGWVKVALPDGRLGWIVEDSLEEI